MLIKEYPTLYSLASTGKVKVWKIEVVHFELYNYYDMVTTSGYIDGKMKSTSRKILVGKNIGKANETSPKDQALSEARSKWQKKVDAGGVESVDNVGEVILPSLAHKYIERKHNIKFPCYAQPKLNGVRCLATKGDSIEFTSRTGKVYTTLKHLVPELVQLMDNSRFDGEVYVHQDLTFQEICSAVKKQSANTLKLQYWVYDLCIKDWDFKDRIEWLSVHLPNDGLVQVVDTFVVNNEEELFEYHAKFVKEGYEGTIIRNMEGGYVYQYRSTNLQKYKDFIDEEFKIIGGKADEEGCVVFKCKCDGGEFDVRPKGSQEIRREWVRDLDDIIGEELTVRYQNLSDDGIPIFPVGVVIRDYE